MRYLVNAIIIIMDLNYTVDNEVGAAYLHFGRHTGNIVSTANYQQDKNIDFDVEGNIVGIEFLSLPPKLDFSGLADYVKLDPDEVLMVQNFLAGIAD